MTQLATTKPAGGGLRAVAAELAKTSANPLLMLPADWRPAVSGLWAANAHLLPSSLSLCATLRYYADRLDAADVDRITASLMDPARRATHRFAADLMTDLCSLVGTALARKESAAANADRERERAEYARGLATGAGLDLPAVGRLPDGDVRNDP